MQWHPDNFAAQGWFNRDVNGSPPWRNDATLLKAVDWWAFRDPAAEWYRPFVDRQAAIGHAIKHAVAGARRSGAFPQFAPRWLHFLGGDFAVYRFVEYGLFLALCQAQRECASDVIAQPIIFQSLEKDRHAQDITRYCVEIEECVPGFADTGCKALWIDAPEWQPLRRFTELLLATRDWGEIHVVVNLIFESLIAPLFTRELVLRHAALHGDFVTPAVVAGAEADRELRRAGMVALVDFLLAQDAGNRAVISAWLTQWMPCAFDAVAAFEQVFARVGANFEEARDAVVADHAALLARLKLEGDFA